MDKTYSWHKGDYGLNHKWSVPIPLLPDELLSSWLVRTAFGHGCDPLALTGYLWPDWRAWTQDFDRGLNKKYLSILTEISGIKASKFFAASLQSFISIIHSKNINKYSNLPWILPVGIRNRRRHGGLQYCPLCFSEDKEPYFRVQWRLAWHTICPIHNVNLMDKCPTCMSPIEPHRLLPSDGNMGVCATCKQNLKKTIPINAEAEALLFQQTADRVVKCKYGFYGKLRLPSAEWFLLSRFFVTLLIRTSPKKSKGLTLLAEAVGINLCDLIPSETGLSFELLPVNERIMLISGVRKLFKFDASQLLELLIKLSITASTLCESQHSLPVCIKDILKKLQQNNQLYRKKIKNNSSSPNSKITVMRMWKRLQRKYRDYHD